VALLSSTISVGRGVWGDVELELGTGAARAVASVVVLISFVLGLRCVDGVGNVSFVRGLGSSEFSLAYRVSFKAWSSVSIDSVVVFISAMMRSMAEFS